ncbi:uncharacterized protein LOC127838916 [Dreissena polymorpha]|uniref:uncharacterized protein LOC127838916 n=1 Tax=Dreissena polymorpha TaxID=45954 RepID=UPI002264DD0F|nr:uncharacterized protein LOC127838916 [Dreissena polymorpha]
MMAPPASYLELGVKYICPSWQFLRYDYFERRLQDFLPRFLRIIENGGLTESFPNGPVMKKDIDRHSQEFSDTVSVYVLGHVNSLSLPDSLLVSNTKEPSVPSMKVDISEPMETDEPISIISNNRRVDSLPKLSQETSSSWSDFKAAISGASSYKTCFAVFVISNKQEEEEAISLYTQLPRNQRSNVLIFSTEDQKCYEFHNRTDSLQPTDLALAESIQRMLEVKIVALFDDIAQFLRKFRLKDVCRPDDRLYYAVDLGLRNSLMDEYTLLDIIPVKEESTEVEIKSKQNELDHNLTEFVKRKTKCILVLHFATEHGMPQDFVLEFLSEGYFELDKEISEILDDVSKPRLEEVKERGSNRWKFREFVQSFAWKASKVLDKAQEYIQKKVEYFQKVGKLEFEMYGILQLSSVPIETKIPVLPTISLECQCKILEIPEVSACGHLYGKFTLFLDKPLSNKGQQDIQSILKEYQYLHDYNTVECFPVRQVKCIVSSGHLLWSDKSNGNAGGVTFTLGCFVRIQELNLPQPEMYAISCEHCVEGCSKTVFIVKNENKSEFGCAKHEMGGSQFHDIVAIKVTGQVHCDSRISMNLESGTIKDVPWNIYKNGINLGQSVSKNGSRTGVTTGVVISKDTLSKDAAGRLYQPESATQSNMSTPFQILVEPNVDDNQSEKLFSEKGDSGSVIYMEDPNTNTVQVVALLTGALTHGTEQNPGKYICTYGSHFNTLIKEFERTCQIKVEPACDP